MFIIFGRRILGKTIKEGVFSCPDCQSQQGFELKSRRNFFTLFFIPLIPLQKMPDRLVCKRCKNGFLPGSILSKHEYQASQLIHPSRSSHQEALPLASPGKRIGSFLIDIALLTLLNFPLAILISSLPENIRNSLPQNFIVVFLFVWFCYFLFMDISSQGQTIGKKILGIKVVQEEGLKPPERGNAIIRNAIKTISGPLLIIFLFTNHHKTLHDMAAGTVVVEE